jgi:hypothetical protein
MKVAKKIFISIGTLLVLNIIISSCGGSTKNNDKSEEIESSQKSPTDIKLDELLPLLSVELSDECFSFPSFIESPYQEFADIAAKGGLLFDGEKRKFNKQYSYYSTKRDVNNFHLSWKTELGSIDKIEITTLNDVPFLKADWTSDDGENKAEARICPVINNEQAPEVNGSIQYVIFTEYWRVIGYRKVTENDFYAIIKKMGEIKGVDFSKLKIVKPTNKKEVSETTEEENNSEDINDNDQEIFTINDPDGYTNVREEKNSTSKILFKINEGEEFKVLSKKGDWWEIEFNEKTGFVHKSRIISVEN